ncbi:hypothetical protein [Prosthecobacter sp.]|uniref:hypothetical protein n=1 Tax=Prosthecobacter sp. TaxID=1965333 RepID=UPI0037832230
MKRRLPIIRGGVLSLIYVPCMAMGQATVPPLTQAQKEAAAAIEAPKTFMVPPVPGQLQNSGPPAPANVPVPSSPAPGPAQAPMPGAPAGVPAPAATVPPGVVPSESSLSKMQALEAVTQKPAVTEVPRVASPSEKAPVTSSTSTSRQFVVHGKVFETRSAMSTRCEEIAQEVRKVLNDKEPWVLPIVVLLNTGEAAAKAQGPAISTTVSELTFGGFHLQVTVNEQPGMNVADLRKEVVRALLAERILRNHQKMEIPKGRLMLPDWILTGVLHAMDYRATTSPSAVFASLFRSGKVYGIEEIIEASPTEMDGLSRTIYDTSCSALVLALVDQPNGPEHLNKFLNSLAVDPRSERELLSAAFPGFAASASSLNKWWSLQLASLAKPGVAEPLTAAESLKAIEEAITIQYEALPADVPKNVKMHPFVLPAPLQVVDAPAPAAHASQSSANAAAKPKAKGNSTAETKDKEKETEATSEEDGKPKRSLLRRLLFLGDGSPKEGEGKTADKEASAADAEKSRSKMESLAKAAESAAAAEKDAKAQEEKKPGFMGRLFGGGGEASAKKEPEKEAAAAPATEKPKTKTESVTKAAEKPAESAAAASTAVAEKEAKAEEEKKPGFMGRLFGAGTGEKKVSEKEAAAAVEKPKTKVTENSAAPAAKTATTEKSKPKAKAETKKEPVETKEPEPPKEEKKPTKLNPMNWFRGGKKPADETPKEEADKPATKDKQALAEPPTAFDVARLISPVLADAWQLLAPDAPRPTAEPLFDFRKRKPKPEEEPKVEPKEEKKPAPAADEKPAAKKSSKPRSTNPNSKPVAKTKSAESDKPRTTNPNAKPATAEQIKSLPPSTTAGTASPLVPVSLPLEEYQRILKHPDRTKILAENVAALRALELRVSVLFRPVVRGYLVAVLDIEAGRTKDMEKRLVTLHEFALIAYQKSIAVRDYLDWFEASESGGLSRKFDNYLNLPETIKKELPPRTDPISKYLDAIDREFSK